MSGPASRFLHSQGLRLHYADWGNPEAPPLILLHGGRDHCRNWDGVAEALRADWHIIAPDLRGHGDSNWANDGNYIIADYAYDLVQLIHRLGLAPVTIIGHSLGGNIALRTAGIYPALFRRLVAIEGFGPSLERVAARMAHDIGERMREWIEDRQRMAERPPRRYPSIDEACRRMQASHARLAPQLAHHLTVHGVRRNEDGSYSWKFDNRICDWPPYDMSFEDAALLWSHITCPTLLIYGRMSRATQPEDDGPRLRHLRDKQVVAVEGASHWVHHDRLDGFLDVVREFL